MDALQVANINTTNCVAALSCGAAVFSGLIAYYARLGHSFIGKPIDKIYYYMSCCVCTYTVLFYVIQLINIYVQYDSVYSPHILKNFYVEWMVATPLLIIKLGQLGSFSMLGYIGILIFNELLFLSGYVFNISSNVAISMVFFGLGALCFTGIIGILIYKYNKYKSLSDILTQKTTKTLIVFTAVAWTFYPTVSLLYKFDAISLDKTVIAYVTLDIFCKGLFTLILIGSRELAVRRNSAISYIARATLRIRPADLPRLDTETDIATSSADEFCRQVNIDDENPRT